MKCAHFWLCHERCCWWLQTIAAYSLKLHTLRGLATADCAIIEIWPVERLSKAEDDVRLAYHRP